MSILLRQPPAAPLTRRNECSSPELPPHEVWQEVFPAGSFPQGGPFSQVYPAALDDGRQILLPIRQLPDRAHAVASLIINQASFAVVDALADDLAGKLAPFAPEVVVGLPTLGLTLAAEVARRLGHARYVPLGTSRKFWYRDDLAVPISSITTPDQVKRLYVDPRMLDLLQAKRVALVDDAISTGTSMLAGLALLTQIGVRPVTLGAAMLQSERWRLKLADWQSVAAHCFTTPLLQPSGGGYWRLPDEAR